MRLGVGKGLALSLLVTIGLLTLLEVAAGLALRSNPGGASRRRGIREERHCEYDADLGWMNLPSVRIEDLYGPGASYTTNSQRFRASRDYTAEVRAGRYRVICLGDSFTMGYGVDDADTFPARLESLSDELEVINMGLGGFGVDQDYLWFERDGAGLEADALLFCVVVADFQRMTTDVFQERYPKPTLSLEKGELAARNVPVPRGFDERAGRGADYPWRGLNLVRLLRSRGGAPLPPQGDSRQLSARRAAHAYRRALIVSEHVFAELHRESEARGRRFAVVLLPSERHLGTEPPPVERWLEEFTERADIPFLNLFPLLRAVDPEELPNHFTQGHYAPIANQLVAEELLRWIESEWRD